MRLAKGVTIADQGYGDIAAHGNQVVKTPNLDQMHGESVRLTEFHASPTCAPTRAALMTGRHEFRPGSTMKNSGPRPPNFTA